MRANLAELKSAINDIQSNLDALTTMVNKAEELFSDLKHKLIEKKEQEEA